MPRITLLPDNRILPAQPGDTLHSVLARAGLLPQAACGGQGSCGKCRVNADGRQVLACQTPADRDMTVTLPGQTHALPTRTQPGKYAAFDIGTTSVVCCLLDENGQLIAKASARNPQAAFGADVISRLRAAMAGQQETLTRLIRETMAHLLLGICSNPAEVETVAIAGNPAMQQLFLGLDIDNLTRLPYHPLLNQGTAFPCREYLPVCPRASLITTGDISAFVGADTICAVLSCGLQEAEELTLLVDIGTNGEMVLGNRHTMIACSTAAGPALEGANISCGMRAEPGAIEKVWLEQGQFRCRTVGDTPATGICGSGLLDAVACALDLGLMNPRGKLLDASKKIMLTEMAQLTQEDIRQVQLAKGAIAAGIALMAQEMGVSLADIQKVVLAGAFGSLLDPDSACRIGLLPQELLGKITSVGNAAADGACRLAADPGLLETANRIVKTTRYLDLAALPAFPKAFARAMGFSEDWCRSAKGLGFTHACPLDPKTLQTREDVRTMCAADKCHAYGKNWTCPPHCGALADCQKKMHQYRRGILLQTVGYLKKDIDTRTYRETEQRHLESFSAFCDAIRKAYPDALCLGTGGCRLCSHCAFPEPCRFPEKATSSMEGYGLFVTQVCRDAGLPYHHGAKTITYTACVLYDK